MKGLLPYPPIEPNEDDYEWARRMIKEFNLGNTTPETPAEFLERELKAAQEASGVAWVLSENDNGSRSYADGYINNDNILTLVIVHDGGIRCHLRVTNSIKSAKAIRTQAQLLTIAADIAERWEARQ